MTNREAVENNNVVIFEAEDVNDPTWDVIISTLREHIPGFNVGYGDGDWMAFAVPKEIDDGCLFGDGNECPDECVNCTQCPYYDSSII